MTEFDALLFVSFGGPEGPDDVIPFLENVLRGKNVPRERMMEVATHYQEFGGVSPINEQNRNLISALEAEMKVQGIELPVYWGNRNWHPMIPDTLKQMKEDGHRKILMFMTSSFSSYSGCRQYREDIAVAQQEIGDEELSFAKLRVFYNHPGFIEPSADLLSNSLSEFENPKDAHVLFTAHSIPDAMARGCRYETQLNEACKLVAEKAGHSSYELVYQSRSGPPTQPWLEPDVCDRIEELNQEGKKNIVIAPIGFISDHMEVLFDLDTEARELCDKLGIHMVRTPTVGTNPRFVKMICELIQERSDSSVEKSALGDLGPSHDACPINCCLSGRPGAGRPTVASAAE